MDDGLVLNLFTEEIPQAARPAGKKGGRWTDRLKAKRVEKRKAKPEGKSRQENQAASQNEETFDTRLVKKPRTAAKPINAPSHHPSKAAHNVISSLFTSNPEIAPAAAPQPRTHSKPSNAPLTDASTFTGLGLDPLISTHLDTKMGISKPTAIQRSALPVMLPPTSAPDPFSDVFIQSQTGSGKTLAFLLPILQDLLPLCSLSYIDRSIGTLAIILAPTRELAKQTSDVLERLLQLRLRAADDAGDGDTARRTRWLVSGLLSGGADRAHEKARLRKGVPILVATPGRLLDHLQNTAAFDVGKCRWLVLDEADRLMDLGFEETVRGILAGLDGRRRLALQAREEGTSREVGGWEWKRRRTVLCSATMRDDVQKLAGTALVDPVVVKALGGDAGVPGLALDAEKTGKETESFTPPAQLAQRYVVVPLKLRLVTLVALLRSLVGQTHGGRGCKIIVFLSCTDSVDFHWQLLGGARMDGDDDDGATASSDSASSEDADSDAEHEKPAKRKAEPVQMRSPLLPNTAIFRLHGSLPLPTRLASLKGFSAPPARIPGAAKGAAPEASILLCTSVASRGLDLPLVRAVVQHDLPTEGGATEYVHRVGRTARAGRGGEAWSIVGPSEEAWVPWVEGRMRGAAGAQDVKLEAVASEEVLRKGFGGKGREYEERATEVQLAFERWVLRKKEHAEGARKAFLSHMRAYATHPSDEKHIFHIRHLHIGHLAKAFALREAPSAVGSAGNKVGAKSKSKMPGSRRVKDAATGKAKESASGKIRGLGYDVSEGHDGDAERRMQAAVRAQGKTSKKGGVMMSSGTAEFQVASTDALERLVNRT